MAWLTPQEFETAVKIERTEGRAGFGALLAAAASECSDNYTLGVIGQLWFGQLNDYHWRAGTEISDRYTDEEFVTLLAAAAMHADLENQGKIEQICPGLNRELSIRYNTPGSMVSGEQRTMDGKPYKCVEVLSEGFGKYIVVEVTNG